VSSLAALNVKKTKVEFSSGGTRCRGWFFEPLEGPARGCVILAHGFGAAPDGPLGQTARRFAAAGMAALAFDFRHFGISDGEPRQVLNVERQLEDWAAAIAYVRSRGDIDPRLIGLWGSSLSGGQVLAIAARDHGIAAVVSQAPFADGISVARAAGLRHHVRTAPAVIRDLLRTATGRSPYLIDAIGPPGEASAVTARFTDMYYDLVTSAPSWVNKINASYLLDMYRFRPIRLAHEIQCPLLVVLVYHDLIAPSDVTMRVAQSLPYVELALFHGRHFDLYVGEMYERAVRTETQFFIHQFARAQRRGETPTAPAPAPI
jgi:fermentation-respiration switch protein FrsA (DUF1100 family)